MSDNPNVLVFPPLLYSGTVVVSLLLHWFKPWYLTHSWPVRIVGIALIVGAAALGIWGEKALKRAGTNVNPMQPTLAIVSDGPYRFTRNPMYVGLILAYLGEAGLLRQIWPVILSPLVVVYVNWIVIPLEESKLREVFGEQYDLYRKKVRRWL